MTSHLIVRPVTATANYWLNRTLVFRSGAPVPAEYARYLLSMVYILVLSSGILMFLTTHLGMAVYLAKPIAEITTFLASFLLSGAFVYGQRRAAA